MTHTHPQGKRKKKPNVKFASSLIQMWRLQLQLAPLEVVVSLVNKVSKPY